MLKNEIHDGDDRNDNNMKEHVDKHNKRMQKSLVLCDTFLSSELKTIGIVTQNNTNNNEHACVMRRFWVRNCAWVNYNRFKPHMQGKRNKVFIREHEPPAAFVVLLIVFGMVFMIFF